MRNFFRRRSSRDIACDRLISRYMKIDAANMEIQINTRGKGSKGGKTPTLNANIPILDMHNQ